MLGSRVFGVQSRYSESDRKLEAAWAGAAWIEVEDAVRPGNFRLVGVAEDYGCDAGGVRMQVEILARMQHVNQFSIELD